MVRGVDGDAPYRPAVDALDAVDVARRHAVRLAKPASVAEPLPRQPPAPAPRYPPDAVLGTDVAAIQHGALLADAGAVSEAARHLGYVVRQRPARRGYLDTSGSVLDVAVRVHETGEQTPSLLGRGTLVHGRDMLVAQQPEAAQRAAEAAVHGVASGCRASRAPRRRRASVAVLPGSLAIGVARPATQLQHLVPVFAAHGQHAPRAVPVAEPEAEQPRIDRQVGVREARNRRPRRLPLALAADALPGPHHLPRRDDAPAASGPAIGARARAPLVLGVGNDLGTVAPDDAVALAVEHDRTDERDVDEAAVAADDLVADPDVAHGAPPGRHRNRRVDIERLAPAPAAHRPELQPRLTGFRVHLGRYLVGPRGPRPLGLPLDIGHGLGPEGFEIRLRYVRYIQQPDTPSCKAAPAGSPRKPPLPSEVPRTGTPVSDLSIG